MLLPTQRYAQKSHQGFKMKVGDTVWHKKMHQIGIIHEISTSVQGTLIMVDWTDTTGVMFRWARTEDLELIDKD